MAGLNSIREVSQVSSIKEVSYIFSASFPFQVVTGSGVEKDSWNMRHCRSDFRCKTLWPPHSHPVQTESNTISDHLNVVLHNLPITGRPSNSWSMKINIPLSFCVFLQSARFDVEDLTVKREITKEEVQGMSRCVIITLCVSMSHIQHSRKNVSLSCQLPSTCQNKLGWINSGVIVLYVLVPGPKLLVGSHV